MKRKEKSKPTAIFMADPHIRGDKPICRTDDYMKSQGNKMSYILELSQEYECPIFIAGDLGNKPLWGDKLLNWFMSLLPPSQRIYAIAGQHDLPNHRLDKWNETGMGVLEKSGYIKVLNGLSHTFNGYLVHPFPYSKKMVNYKWKNKEPLHIAIAHQMVIKSPVEKLWAEQKADNAMKMLRRYPCYDLIVTGDNHQSFMVEYEGRWLVNPGSMMRETSAQINHKPTVYLWYKEDNILEPHLIPIKKNVIDTSHITEVKEREERFEAYITKMEDSYDIGFSFEDNLKKHLNVNMSRKKVVKKVWESLV